MANIITIFEYFNQKDIFYSPIEHSKEYVNEFRDSDLGAIYAAIPWSDLVKFFFPNRIKGRKYLLPERTQIALMFLKNYTGLSDRQLMEHLRGNIFYQIFCGIHIKYLKSINYKHISAIRVRLAERLNTNAKVSKYQKIMIEKWKPYINFEHPLERLLNMDATCYESSVRYPTDAKLLQEAIDFMHQLILSLSKYTSEKIKDDHYYKISKTYKLYSRKRKRSKKEEYKLRTKQVKLLGNQIFKVLRYEQQIHKILKKRQLLRYETIKKVYQQQSQLLRGEKVSHRVVSLHKSYLRPIVRGKETKRVEFGNKAHILNVDKIDLIEYLSFEAYNESKRLKSSVSLVESLFGEVRLLGGDNIYQTNENRHFCTSKGIMTSFVRKGKASKNEYAKSIVRKSISKIRSTQMEGSFGVHKQFYGLSKIRAATEATEMLWIVFGIYTKNSLEIGRRIRQVTENKTIAV